jgi:hypothetical protein
MGSSSGFMTSNGVGPVSTMLSGSGKIQGFATTLLIVIATSLFTSIFITRILLDWSVARNNKLTFTNNIKSIITQISYLSKLITTSTNNQKKKT